MRPMFGPNGNVEHYQPWSSERRLAIGYERRRIAEMFVAHRMKLQTAKRIVQAETLQRELDHIRNQPVALARLETADRDESATRLLFQGLQQHYRECLMAGRLDVWATAAHNIVDLLSDPLTKVHKRAAVLRS